MNLILVQGAYTCSYTILLYNIYQQAACVCEQYAFLITRDEQVISNPPVVVKSKLYVPLFLVTFSFYPLISPVCAFTSGILP